MVTIDSKLNAVPFHEKEYWERRFEKESHFEWLLTWSDIEQHVTPYLKDQKTILHLGCGNSDLSFDMSDSGHKHIINVDYAQNVIEQMKEVTLEKEKYAHKDYSGLSWYVGDCLNNLPYYLPTTDKYSIVLDKSLSDCIACGDDEDQSLQKQLAMETLAVTDQDAIWLSVSFSNERKQDWSDANGCYWKLEKRVPVLVKQKNDKPNAPDIYYYLSIYRKAQIP